MEDAFRFADEIGPAKIIHVHEPAVGLRGTLVVDNVALGPSIGGLRMAADVSTEECFRLARAMTFKNAAAGLPHGGGKSVIYGDPHAIETSEKELLIRAMAWALRDAHDYIFGPDMGTDETCMAWVDDEIGRAVGLPREIGGIPLDEIGATAWGLAAAAEMAAADRGFELAGARVAIQGFGSVGRHAARFLAARGAVIIGVSDSRGAVASEDGLDVEALSRLKDEGKSVVDHGPARQISGEALIGLACEIWVPAARPDVIHEENVDQLDAKSVVPGANIPVTPGAEKRLHERGILLIPDFIANAGGVICAAMEHAGASEASVMDAIDSKVRANTAEVLARVKRGEILPRQAAVELARERVDRARGYRRWAH